MDTEHGILTYLPRSQNGLTTENQHEVRTYRDTTTKIAGNIHFCVLLTLLTVCPCHSTPKVIFGRTYVDKFAE